MSILVVAEHRQGVLCDITRELITAGRDLGSVTVAVIGSAPASLAGAVNVDGVDEIVTIPIPTDEFETDPYQAAVEALVASRRPRVTLLGFTVNSMGYGPAVAMRLGLGFASDVHGIALDGEAVVATRSFYGSKVSAELDFPASEGVLLLLRPAAWPCAVGQGNARISSLEVASPPSRARHIEFVEPTPSSDVDITKADFLLAIGRGVGDEKSIDMFKSLAQTMGATLSVSRPLVDAGWMPASRQVGQSGKTVTPSVYLALGISGAVQHVAGLRDAGTIIAINTDPEAAIFNVARFGAKADLFDVAEELAKLY